MAKFTIEVEPVADDSELRRQLADALAAVEEWRALAKRHETQTSAWLGEAQAEKHTREMLADDLAKCGEELATARAENERLRGELELAKASARMGRVELARVAAERDVLSGVRESLRLCRRELSEVDRKLRDANADRDRAIAERDEARKALADEVARGQNIGIAGCNLKAGSHVVWMDSAELAALRARVAELELGRNEAVFKLDLARKANERMSVQIDTVARAINAR